MKVFTVKVDPTTSAFLLKNGFLAEIGEDIESPEDVGDWADGNEAIVVDLDAVGWNAYSVRFIRSNRVKVPIIGLSKGSTDVPWSEHRAQFLEHGGDDLLKSPPNPRELAATLRALTRRSTGVLFDMREFETNTAKIRVDLVALMVFVDGIQVHVTGKEFRVVEALAVGNGRTMSKDAILNSLYRGAEQEAEAKIVDVFICKIRKKMAAINPDAEALIETVWGRGYRLTARATKLKEVAA